MLTLNVIHPFGIKDDSIKSNRKIYDYDENETPSYIPNAFLDERLLKNPASASIKFNLDTNDEEGLVKLAEMVKEDIKNHVEVRLQLFCLQLVLVHKTELVFNINKTKAQAGIKNKISPQKSCPSKLQELHASTLPNLRFVRPDSLELLDISLINEYVFGLETSFYKNWNTTHKLPTFVNDMDSLIDKNIQVPFYNNFRQLCIRIINDVSKGGGIEKGYKCFLLNLLRVIEQAQKNDLKKHSLGVISWYSEVVKAYDTKLDSIFKSLFKREIKDLEPFSQSLQLNFKDEVEIARILTSYPGTFATMRFAMVTLIGLTKKSQIFNEYIVGVGRTDFENTTTSESHANGLTKDLEIRTAATALLVKVEDVNSLKDIHIEFSKKVKEKLPKGTKRVENIALRVLQKLSEEEKELQYLGHFYRYFTINSERVKKSIKSENPTSAFQTALVAMKTDPQFKHNVERMAGLLVKLESQYAIL